MSEEKGNTFRIKEDHTTRVVLSNEKRIQDVEYRLTEIEHDFENMTRKELARISREAETEMHPSPAEILMSRIDVLEHSLREALDQMNSWQQYLSNFFDEKNCPPPMATFMEFRKEIGHRLTELEIRINRHPSPEGGEPQ